MKKGILFFAVAMLIAMNAMAYSFGRVEIDPMVGMHKEVSSPWYGSLKPIFLGDKPNVALAWNKKDSTHGMLQMGIDASGQKVFMVGPKDLFGLSLSGLNLSQDIVGMGVLYDMNRNMSMIAGPNSNTLVSSNDLTIEASNTKSISIDGGTTDIKKLTKVGFSITSVTPGSCAEREITIVDNGQDIDLCYCKTADHWFCASMTAVVVP